jgi:hypothetical protein
VHSSVIPMYAEPLSRSSVECKERGMLFKGVLRSFRKIDNSSFLYSIL